MGVFNRTIITLILVGYEVVIPNSAIGISLATYHSYQTYACRLTVKYDHWNENCAVLFIDKDALCTLATVLTIDIVDYYVSP